MSGRGLVSFAVGLTEWETPREITCFERDKSTSAKDRITVVVGRLEDTREKRIEEGCSR